MTFAGQAWDILVDILGGHSGSPLEHEKLRILKGDGFTETVAFDPVPR